MNTKIDIKSLDFKELNNLVSELGEKSFRAKQIYEWLHVKLVHSFEEMSNLSKSLMQLIYDGALNQKRLEKKYLGEKPIGTQQGDTFCPINDKHIKAQEIQLFGSFMK